MQPKIMLKVRDLNGWRGHAALYRCIPPLIDYHSNAYQHVVISSVDVPYTGPETYIFPSDENGKVLAFSELDGSYRGDKDHIKAIENAGYEFKE